MMTWGIILIALILGLYGWWLYSMLKVKGVSGQKKDGGLLFHIQVKGVYSPNVLNMKSGQDLILEFKREEDAECSRFVNFPDFKIRKELPKDKIVKIEIKNIQKGNYNFMCDMGMYQGKLIVK